MEVFVSKKIPNNNLFLMNYADENFSKAQFKNSRSALKNGGFCKVFSYSPADIDRDFINRNDQILSQKTGNGYWLWKPYLIKKTLEQIDFGTYLFYCDSGSYFKNSIVKIISAIDQNQCIIPFETKNKEYFWTKRDAFVLMNCDFKEYSDTRQRLAGFILMKKTLFTMKFIDEWLKYSQDIRLISNANNTEGLSNYEGFIEHRHDQSIFSLLSKKYKLDAYRDPSQYGNYRISQYSNSNYNQIIELTRKRNNDFKCLSICFNLKYNFIRLKRHLIKILKHLKTSGFLLFKPKDSFR